MPNVLFELDRLKVVLINKGLDESTVEKILNKARNEIRDAFRYQGDAAMDLAIEQGVNKRSADFINELKLDEVNMELTTESGNMDFSTPPYPNLANLLNNAKPIKDGSGVYKVIPVGQPSKRPGIATNIYDSMKQVSAERAENARKQYAQITPSGSVGKKQFRTATSKQDANTRWVIPGQNKDFYEEVKNLNTELTQTMDDTIRDIIRNYEESF